MSATRVAPTTTTMIMNLSSTTSSTENDDVDDVVVQFGSRRHDDDNDDSRQLHEDHIALEADSSRLKVRKCTLDVQGKKKKTEKYRERKYR
jgi:hypothetical protein